MHIAVGVVGISLLGVTTYNDCRCWGCWHIAIAACIATCGCVASASTGSLCVVFPMCYIPHMRCSPLCVFFRMCDLPLCAIFRYALSSAMCHPPLCAVFRYVLFPTRLPELASLCVERLHVTINVVHACFCRGGHARVRTILFVHLRDRSAHHTFCARTCAHKIRCAHRGLVYVR